jgi:DNA-3-methyladenine glycosylase I
MTATLCPDGLRRCPWGGITEPDYLAYHDREWGVETHGEVAMFERLSLEGFQSGLSWLTILRKREALRAAFAGFDPTTVAGFGEVEVSRFLADASIVRNRRKIEAVIGNARAVTGLGEPLDALLWSFAPTRSGSRAPGASEVPSKSPESEAMSRELKHRGFAFVGPTTAYALMQATGMVDDHVAGCWRARA